MIPRGRTLFKQGEIGSWVRVPVGPCAFFFPVIFGGSVWVRTRAASSKGTVSSVSAWFREDSVTTI